MSSPSATSTFSNPFNPVLNFIFSYSYPLAFMGAMFYGIASFVQFDPSTIIANKNISIFINALIGICGTIAVFNWYENNQIPFIGSYIVPGGSGVIKPQGP
jgi:hypothetical protein